MAPQLYETLISKNGFCCSTQIAPQLRTAADSCFCHRGVSLLGGVPISLSVGLFPSKLSGVSREWVGM